MASTASTATTKKTSAPVKAPSSKGPTAAKTSSKTTTSLREASAVKEQKPIIVAPPPQTLKEPEKPALKRPAKAPISPEERHRMIRDAAYYRAERRGFMGGDPRQDWLDAEDEIDQLLMKRS